MILFYFISKTYAGCEKRKLHSIYIKHDGKYFSSWYYFLVLGSFTKLLLTHLDREGLQNITSGCCVVYFLMDKYKTSCRIVQKQNLCLGYKSVRKFSEITLLYYKSIFWTKKKIKFLSLVKIMKTSKWFALVVSGFHTIPGRVGNLMILYTSKDH